jgi:3-deoxy-D-manno-octulosonic-acid transferase
MIFLYRIILNIILILSPFIFIIRLLKKKETLKSYSQKILINDRYRPSGKLIWFHGASVGEIKSVIPILEKLEKNSKYSQILVTSNTLSSANIVKNLKSKKIIHQFFPIDSNFILKKFIDFWNPSKVIFIDSELWPNTLVNLKKREIPVVLLNARITKKSFKRWMKFKNFARKIFSLISISYPANQETKKYLKILKVKKIKFLNNLKYAEPNHEILTSNRKVKKYFKNRNIWCAASTHYNEEIICGNVHLKLKSKIKNLLTIIIPRHIKRCEEIKSDLEKLNLKVMVIKSAQQIKYDVDVLILDAYGKTKLFFENSPNVFLGGSLINHGGQNPLEAARIGCNVLYGPNIDNFREVYSFLNNIKIAQKVSSENDIIKKLIVLFRNKNRSNKNYLNLRSIGKKILERYYDEIIQN